MRNYNVRTESAGEGNGFICWIDINNEPVIYQANAPHLANQGNFANEEDARSWGDSHVLILQEADIKIEEEAARLKNLQDLQEASYQAQIDTANYLKTIVDSLP